MAGFSPLPEGCLRARCGCSWWIAVPRHFAKGKEQHCNYCGLPFRKIDREDLRLVGLELPEGESVEQKRPYPSNRKNKRSEPRESRRDPPDDHGDNRTEPGVRGSGDDPQFWEVRGQDPPTRDPT